MSAPADPPPRQSDACPVCGASIPDAAGGMCPRCLMADAAEPTQAPGTGPGGKPPSLAEVTAAFSQFEVIELIGAGGMGTVWRARQPKLNRHVALKLLPASLAERDPAFAERFEREGQLLARLHHPNIVAVHDSGRAGNFFYLVMEFVDGVNLRQAMRASRFTPQQALAIVPKICDALQYAHEEGVLHRDIKPENILLDAKGRVKLVDFGIAKVRGEGTQGTNATHEAHSTGLTQSGSTLGTPSYMAPEQRDAPTDVDHRADIYSLGVVFYELLTGELPLGKFAPPSEKSAADPRLDGIVRQALEKERERRQQSVGEMKTQVETIVSASDALPKDARITDGLATGGNFHPPRFSRSAIAGACWIIFFFAVVPAFIAHEVETHEFWHAGPFASALMCFVWFVFLIPAFISPFGATLLGYIAVSRIRRSRGQLYGTALAVFDGLFFPLVALDALIVLGAGNLHRFYIAHFADVSIPLDRFILGDGFKAIIWMLSLAAIPLADFFVIRAVWRVANRASSEPQHLSGMPEQNSAASTERCPPNPFPAFSGLGALAIGLSILSAVPAAFALGLFPRGSRLLLGSAALTALAAIFLGVRARPTRSGKAAIIAGSLMLIIAGTRTILSPASGLGKLPPREAIEQRLLRDIACQLDANSERYKALSVRVSPDLGSAEVSLTGLQELKGIDGRNVWTDIAGTLTARYAGESAWMVKGDGALGHISFSLLVDDIIIPAPSPFPKASHISREHKSVMVIADDVTLHYVFYYPGDFSTSSRGSQNTHSLSWMDEGSIRLNGNGRAFGYHRESVYPQLLSVNGENYDLSRGRVFVLHDDGSVEQLRMGVRLSIAKDPVILARAIDGKPAVPDANLVYGPIVERELFANETLTNSFLDLDTGKVWSAPKELLDSLRAKGRLYGGHPPADDLREWMSANGGDVIARVQNKGEPAELLQVDGVSGMAGETPFHGAGYRFDSAPARKLAEWTGDREEAWATLKNSDRSWLPAGVSYFKTREGSVGILEILESKSDHIKLKYKLLEPEPAPATLESNAQRGESHDSKAAAIPDPTAGIELKVAQQQLEKTLTELQDTQTALALLDSEAGPSKAEVMKLESKLKVLEVQAERLRTTIQQRAAKQ